MVYLFVGAGQAGSAILDDIMEFERMSTLVSPIVFNSTVRDLQNLSTIGKERWFGVSAQEQRLISGDTAGFEEYVTGGFGRQPEKADETIQRGDFDLAGGMEEILGSDPNIPFAFVFLGLGGGTGCGIAHHIVDAIRRLSKTVKVIAVGILPNTEGPVAEGDDEVRAGRQARNALYGLNQLEDRVDGIILVDNQRLAYEDAAEGRFGEYNEYVASSIVDLISGPIREQINPGKHENLDVPIIDLQDLVTILNLGDGPGYAALGRAVTMTKTLPGYFLPKIGYQSVDGGNLSRLAASKLTLADADPSQARKALGLVRAPAKYLTDSEYRIEISVIRRFLDSNCPEVNLGATLTERNLASFTAVFSFDRGDVDRIGEIESMANRYQTSMASE